MRTRSSVSSTGLAMKSFAPASTACSRCSMRLERRHDDDGHVRPGGILADAAAHIEAVEPGHDDVEQHEIDAELKLGEPFDAVMRRFDFVPKPFDEHLRDSANARVVVDDEHALAPRPRRNGRRIDIRRACR